MNSKSVAKLIKNPAVKKATGKAVGLTKKAINSIKHFGEKTAIGAGGGKKQVMQRLKPKLERGSQTYKKFADESNKAAGQLTEAIALRGKRKAGATLVSQLEEQANKASKRAAKYAESYKQQALRRAQNEVAQRGWNRLKYAGLGLAGLAGAGLLWPKEKNIQEVSHDRLGLDQEEEEREPMYYEREYDPYYNDGSDIIQDSSGTLYIGGQPYNDRDKEDAAAAGFDNVFDYKAYLYHLPNRDAVRALQRQLGLKEDGLFGINTEHAYQEYLRQHPEEAVYDDAIPVHRMGGWIHC